jgi:hypothetical protein
MENKVDWLREAAKGFARLKNIRYDLLIAHAGKTLNLSIGFDNSHFHHIAGLHKLKDIDQLRLRRKRSTAMIFEEIMRGKISLATIENSAFLTSKIIERIKLAGMLESIMDADNLLFSFDARYGQARFSAIPAQYVITDADKSIALYVFLAADGESGYITRSLFRDSKDYTEGQHRFTILSKDKVNIRTKECERLFTYERK